MLGPQVPAQGPSTMMEPTEDLRLAARTVLDSMDKDKWVDFIEILRRPAPQLAQQDLDSHLAMSRIPSFHISDDLFRPMPDALLNHFDNAESSSYMGLLMELQRAWIAIDNKLFLWNYAKGNDFTVWDDQEQLISTVGLVKPRKNIFIKEIEYILVIATSLEILLVGVAFSGPTKELKLYPTGFSVPTDGVRITNINGTSEGRLFLCGANGHVYELVYQAVEGLLSRKCWKIDRSSSFASYFMPTFLQPSREDPLRGVALDESSKVLYTLTGNSIITVYTYGPDMHTFQKVQTLPNLYHDTQQILETLSISSHIVDPSSFWIVSLHVLKRTESHQLCLMAVTHVGLRLYFGRMSWDGSVSQAASASACAISLRTVRMWVPPISPLGMAPATHASAGPNVHTSLYSTGVLIAANAGEETDVLVGISPDVAIIGRTGSNSYAEISSDCQIQGRVWTLAEVPSAFTEISGAAFRAVGAYTITKRRPIDILEVYLQSYNYNFKDIESFTRSYGSDQTCAMSLHLIARGDVSTALQGYYMMAERTYFEQGGKPIIQTRSATTFEGGRMGVALAVPEVVYSGKHNGLVFCFARSIMSIWRKKIAKTLTPVAGKPQFDCNFGEQELTNVYTVLQRLDAFVTRNFDQITKTMVGQAFGVQPQVLDQADVDAQQKETESMTRIQKLIRACLENIQFLSLMMTSFTLLVASIPEARQKELLELNFEGLVTTPKGVSIARELIAASVKKEVDLGRDVEEICESLEQKCPSLCSTTEVLQFKGVEALHKAKNSSGEIQRNLLSQSLQLFMTAVKSMKFAKVEDICRTYIALNFPSGATKLALAFASYQDGSPLQKVLTVGSHPPGSQPTDRELAYILILSLIFSPTSTQPISDANIRTQLQSALQTQDRLFHQYVYEHLFAEGKIQLLLDIRTPQLVEHLESAFQQTLNKPGFSVDKAELLSRIYAVLNAFDEAAAVLFQIGESDSPIEIQKRIGYFTTCMNYLNSTGTSTITTLSLKNNVQAALQVSEIQGEVLQALTAIAPNDPRATATLGRVINDCRFKLMSLDDLWNGIVKPFSLNVQTLLIFHAAGKRDIQHIRQIWRSVIDTAGPPNSTVTYERLCTTINALSKRLMPDEYVFPLGFLISDLEELNYQNRQVAPPGWVIRALSGPDIPIRAVYQQFYELYDSKVYPWSSDDAQQFLLSEFCVVLESWLHAIERRSEKREDLPAPEVDQIIARIMVTPNLRRDLHDKFSGIRRKLHEFYQ
ncbi:hypothetical protein SmJEL517_g02942 [Synchytrium microbalum]|uniref:Nucleoporin Nup133/Nup155-like N-terminal domain-containing protein n=1 Tax=Synchytrium microbalum TaxID=1806994 RepID=A0A507BZV5_9FUNG|nr:uncharacterized protein SmJEL517_g02942 [Synchytrium microbalum]TPX34337.1 hypothetical protein SmJEL517_g02942 [Synchytrium microbalum]